MNKRLENKMMMLKAVLKLLRSNRSLWKDSIPFVNAVNQLEGLIAEIEATLLITDEDHSAYEGDLPNHRVSVSERKAANAKLKDLYKEADEVLTSQIDRLMFRFSTAKPDFYAAYLNARKVVDYGTRHEKPEEQDKNNNKPTE